MEAGYDDQDSDIVKISPASSDISTDPAHLSEGTNMSTDSKPRVERDVHKVVEETVRKVRAQSDRLQAAAMPYADTARNFAETQPVLFTFLALFSALSFIPIFCFVAFVVGATSFILSIAAIMICLSVMGVLFISISLLLPVLLFTAFLSTCGLSALLLLFLAHRLYLHLQTATQGGPVNYVNLRTGVRGWLEETQERVVPGEHGRRFFSARLGSQKLKVEGVGWDGKSEKWEAEDNHRVKSEPEEHPPLSHSLHHPHHE
ncbi:hypothetical protein M231_03398 [Tremella mesenterica]|uniref:Uncharacterized protein n=1 Tax=Tremella mesenterica TaxID=5217 RepID=A0A4Q1BN88_TREME|nr:hypothetical protein M231_03398 [Tremella mesenterica]